MTGVRSRHARGRTRDGSDAKDNQDHSGAVARQYGGAGGDLCRENLVSTLPGARHVGENFGVQRKFPRHP